MVSPDIPGGQRKRETIRGYRRFMEEGKGRGRRAELVGGGLVRSLGGWSQVLSLRGQGERVAYDSRVLGGGDFVMGILREADQRVKRYLPAREKEAFIERIVEEICGKYGFGAGELRLGGQRQAVSRVRGKVGWILSREYGISLAEIARRVGVCTSAIGKAIQKMERQMSQV